jgi:hypothetical protein
MGDVRLSEVRVLDVMDSNHLPIMFCILDHVKAGEILDPVENFHCWGGGQFQNLASALISPEWKLIHA